MQLPLLYMQAWETRAINTIENPNNPLQLGIPFLDYALTFLKVFHVTIPT